ncbi:Fc receptor-like protein 5, partial [Acipenser oxyrinchus oxyrinchus]
DKAVLTLDPPWAVILTGDKITLKCAADDFWYFKWYQAGKKDSLNKIRAQEYTIKKAAVSHSGDYTCKSDHYSSESILSDPIHITVSDEQVILQTPPQPVFEGDALTLRCRVRGYTANWVDFYKDNKELQSQADTELSVHRVSKSNEGSYKCTAWWSSYRHGDSAEVRVSVRERFSTPTLTVMPDASVWEGAAVTLQCGAQIYKQGTQLQYRYIKDNGNLSGAGSQDQHSIPAAELRDTGSYQCEVEAAGTGVKKKSDSVSLTVKGLKLSGVALRVSPIGGVVIEGTSLSLLCSVAVGSLPIVFTWHREGSQGHIARHTAADQRSDELILLRAQESDTGSYCCQAAYGEGEEGISSQSALLTVLGDRGFFIKSVNPV